MVNVLWLLAPTFQKVIGPSFQQCFQHVAKRQVFASGKPIFASGMPNSAFGKLNFPSGRVLAKSWQSPMIHMGSELSFQGLPFQHIRQVQSAKVSNPLNWLQQLAELVPRLATLCSHFNKFSGIHAFVEKAGPEKADPCPVDSR